MTTTSPIFFLSLLHTSPPQEPIAPNSTPPDIPTYLLAEASLWGQSERERGVRLFGVMNLSGMNELANSKVETFRTVA